MKTGTVSIVTELQPDSIAKSVLHLINAILTAGQDDCVIHPTFKLNSIFCESLDQKQIRLVSHIQYGNDERNQEATKD